MAPDRVDLRGGGGLRRWLSSRWQVADVVGFHLALQLALPVFLIYALFEPGDMGGGGAAWWSGVVFIGVVLGWILAIFPWAQIVPYAALIVYPVAAVVGAWTSGGWGVGAACAAAMAGTFYGLRRYASPPPAARAMDIGPPLGPGTYFIGQGGNGSLVNYHFTNESQRYALDILRLNRASLRGWGFFPRDLGRFAIYGAPVLSPCDGTITAALDGLPDMEPWFQRDVVNRAGNHIVIRCQRGATPDGDVYIGLAHLQPGSIVVHCGDQVRAGQPLARAGNSGNTTEPHLHIHAKAGGEPDSMLDGRGVPLKIGARFLMRNDLFRGRRPNRPYSADAGAGEALGGPPPAIIE
ncbi:MAG: M23 family metallopeptidase [Terriglobales bacterium]